MKQKMRYLLSYIHRDLYLEPFCFILFVLSFCFEPLPKMFLGYKRILMSSSILLTDYVFIGGVGATLFNVATTLLFNLILIKVLKVSISGPVYSGLIMICGFSFFGKNILNTLPIYFGIWLFSKFKKVPLKSLIISLLFSTGISPLISYSIFGFGLPYYISIPLGIGCGLLVGFLIPAYTSHTISFHEGYNLYNTGFALGILSAMFYAIFQLCGLKVDTVYLYNGDNSMIFYILLGVVSGGFIVMAILGDFHVFPKYWSMMTSSGRLVSDYIRDYGVEPVMLNFGILGLILLLLFMILSIPLNGILFGSIIAILGCTAFGLHLKNALYVWIGGALAIVVKMAIRQDFEISVYRDINMLVAFVFATGLAPIGGKYGFIYGILGGFIHIVFTPLVISLQGGFDLYNNGLACGFAASILVVCGERIFHKERNRYAKKRKDM